MKLLNSFVGGLAGAISVTILHEIIRKTVPGAPRLDKLGKQATTKLIEGAGQNAPSGDDLYAASMAGDVFSNALYYSAIGSSRKNMLAVGAGLGMLAGLGAITLPAPLDLDPEYSAGTTERKLITVGLYTIGGIVAATVMKALKK